MRLRRSVTPDLQSAGETHLEHRLPADRTAAVSELFDLHYPSLVRMARLLVDDKETAEDVVMDAFVSLHRRWTAIRDPHEAYRYIRSCVLNGARSRLRRRRITRLHERTLRIERPSGEDVAARETDRALVLQLLRGLPARQRQVLVLRYYVDLTETEIAEHLRISRGSVKTHASRGLASLARALEAPE